jgi:hypothetical protein
MNIKELAEQAGEKTLPEYGNERRRNRRLWLEIFLPNFAELVAAQVRARCIELVLAGTDMPVQTRTLKALQQDRKRIAKLIEEDGK